MSRTCTSAGLVELDVDGDGDVEAQVREMCERLLANPLIESYEVQVAGMSARVGIVIFPGSCDEADAFLAAERARPGARVPLARRP